LSLDEWKNQFSQWIRQPHPDALLNATIFFDFRPLFGKHDLAEAMRRHLLQQTQSSPMFLRAMAKNALDVEPPLGKIRDFLTDLEPGQPGKIDLKKYGSRIFVDVARIYALASGVHNTNSVQRLRIAAKRLNIRQGDNLINPDKLNELDRRILKESFRQARKIQTRLKLDYQVN
jgi:CBS domain-containing protein